MMRLSIKTMLGTIDEGHRPPANEAAAALKAATGSIDEAIAEPKIQTVLDKWLPRCCAACGHHRSFLAW